MGLYTPIIIGIAALVFIYFAIAKDAIREKKEGDLLDAEWRRINRDIKQMYEEPYD